MSGTDSSPPKTYVDARGRPVKLKRRKHAPKRKSPAQLQRDRLAEAKRCHHFIDQASGIELYLAMLLPHRYAYRVAVVT